MPASKNLHNNGSGTAYSNHLIGAGEKRGWNVDAEIFRRLEIDHQFELGGLHDRKLGWLFALWMIRKWSRQTGALDPDRTCTMPQRLALA
jgi:hypothetical protein